MRSVLWFEEKPITPAVTQSISILVGEIDRNVRDPTLWISETQAQAGLKCAATGFRSDLPEVVDKAAAFGSSSQSGRICRHRMIQYVACIDPELECFGFAKPERLTEVRIQCPLSVCIEGIGSERSLVSRQRMLEHWGPEPSV